MTTDASAKKRGARPKDSSHEATADFSDLGEVGHFIWDMFSIASHFHSVRQVWAKLAGVTGPQWLILFAISTLDEGEGVSVGRISQKLHVKSTFVTTQSNILEAEGYLTRRTYADDRRVVLLSLSEKAVERIQSFVGRRAELHRMMFGEFDAAEFAQLKHLITRLEESAKESTAALQAQRL